MRAVGLLVAMTGTVAAGPRLEVTGEACAPDGLRAGVVAVTGDDRFGIGPGRIAIETARAGGGVVATVMVEDARGARVGPRRVDAPDCGALVDGLSLIVMMAVPARVAQAVDPSPPEEVAVVATPAPPARVDVLAGVAVSRPDAEVVVGTRWRDRARSLSVELGVQAPERVGVGAMGSVRLWQLGATVSPCGHRGAFAACAVGTVGVVIGTSQGLDAAHTAVAPIVSGGVRVAWEHRLGDRSTLRLHADVAAAATRASFEVDQLPVWTSDRVTAWLGIDVLARVP